MSNQVKEVKSKKNLKGDKKRQCLICSENAPLVFLAVCKDCHEILAPKEKVPASLPRRTICPECDRTTCGLPEPHATDCPNC
jgi:hypothetical protein